ncbi:MAG TPA: hypothetical protein VHE30_16600 [Polyangiaceae bacterium]|nr:hypothetical protein [Polyangiaceae bacterium]
MSVRSFLRASTFTRVAVATAVLGGSAPALAADPAAKQSQEELERARSLFRQGLSLEAAGNWAAALAKFEEVGKVKLTPQVRFHTGRCNEQLGRLNEALGDYRLAEYEAGQQGLPDLAAITQARQALEARIPKLVIRRGQGTETAHVELDGVELGEAQIGQPLAVDPGPHAIVVKLGGDKQFTQSALVKEADTAEVTLVAPAEGAAEPTGPAPGPGGGSAVVDTGANAPKASVLPWVVGGVGVAGLIGAGVFYGLRAGAKSDLDDKCRGNVCPESLKGTEDKGKLYSTLSVVSLGVGVVGVGVATYLFVSGSGKEKPPSTALRLPVDVSFSPSGSEVTVRGAF